MLYIEGAAGISGDMTVGALLSLGASADRLAKALDSMGTVMQNIADYTK